MEFSYLWLIREQQIINQPKTINMEKKFWKEVENTMKAKNMGVVVFNRKKPTIFAYGVMTTINKIVLEKGGLVLYTDRGTLVNMIPPISMKDALMISKKLETSIWRRISITKDSYNLSRDFLMLIYNEAKELAEGKLEDDEVSEIVSEEIITALSNISKRMTNDKTDEDE